MNNKQSVILQSAVLFWKRNRIPFIISMCSGAIIHFWLYSNSLLNPDAIYMGEQYIGGWEVTVGRWGLVLFDFLHGGVNAPILIALLTLIFFSLGGVLLNELFDVEKPGVRILIPLCVVSSPMVSNTLTYPYCSDAYSCAFFLAVLAILMAVKGKGVLCYFTAIICIVLSLSVYQSSLGVAAGASVIVLLLRVIGQPQHLREHRKLLLKLLAVGGIGTAVYYLVLKLLLYVRGLSMMSYKGADAIGVWSVIKAFPTSVGHAYRDFFDFFARQNIMINSYLVRFCYGILFLAFIVAFLVSLRRLKRQPTVVISALILVALVPLACNIVDIVASQTRIILLTSGGMALICPAILAFYSKYAIPKNGFVQSKVPTWSNILLCSVAVLLTLNNALIINADAMVMKASTQQTVLLANRMLMRLEQSEDYFSDAQILIAGVPMNGNYPIVSDLIEPTNQYAHFGLVWGTYDGALNCWRQIFSQKLGVERDWCWEFQYREITATQEFQDMPIFPEDGCIKTINGVLVLKVSEMGE